MKLNKIKKEMEGGKVGLEDWRPQITDLYDLRNLENEIIEP